MTYNGDEMQGTVHPMHGKGGSKGGKVHFHIFDN